MPTVLISSPLVEQTGEHTAESLRRLGCDVRFQPLAGRPEDEVIEALRDVDATVASVERYTRRVIEALPKLRVISRTGVGYDAVDLDAATERGIAVCITMGINDRAVADFAMTLMLALTRELLRGHQEVSSGGWARPLGRDFYGSTVGVVGLGTIGKQLVKRLRGFDTTILAYDVVKDEEFAAANGVRFVELDELLREAEFVSIHAPLLPATRGMIGECELRQMKPTAYLVNTARGPLVQEQALHRALKERWIAGAGIDVFEEEPPIGSPLLDPSLDAIIRGPHMAGVTLGAAEDAARMACESVTHLLGGDAPLHTVVNAAALGR